MEVKGYLRPEDRTKLIAVRAMHPSLDLRILFGRENKISKKSRMTYTQWADKYGFPWAIGKIPKKWLNE